DPRTRFIALLGAFKEGANTEPVPAILLAEKTHFVEDRLPKLSNSFSELKSLGDNDIYRWLLGWNDEQQDRPADVKLTLISPATETHIRKYSPQKLKVIVETPEMYRQVVLPYIQSFPPERIQWVYNILDHITESDTIVYEDASDEQGFVIVPDLKWDKTTISSLYLQCITRNRSLRSLRDLRPAHLPMLTQILSHGQRIAREKYGVPHGEIRMFVHYQPSYYHFHVHIVHLSSQVAQGGTAQLHLLEDVIDNLRLHGDKEYYQNRTLTYLLGEQHGLFADLYARNAS
ncbi:uncharacterized protein L969DRAFT_51567, partial [Mixia osmundae IAM 14324]